MKRTFIVFVLIQILLVTLTAGCITITVPATDDSSPNSKVDPAPQKQEPAQISSQVLVSSFIANPPVITAGNSAKLSWNVSGATSVIIDQGIGNVNLTGEIIVSPKTTTIYKLTASSAVGQIIATTQLVVSPAPNPIPPPTQTVGLPVILLFAAAPDNITAGQSSNLQWNVTNASSVTITPTIYRQLDPLPASGTATLNPQATTTYTLTAINITGMSSQTVTITVNAAPVVVQNWSGTWDTNWGEMHTTQSGNQLIGTYTWDKGKIEGIITGDTFTGIWAESPSYAPPKDAGDLVLTIAPDFNSMTGKWRYGSSGEWDGSWKGKRMIPKPMLGP